MNWIVGFCRIGSSYAFSATWFGLLGLAEGSSYAWLFEKPTMGMDFEGRSLIGTNCSVVELGLLFPLRGTSHRLESAASELKAKLTAAACSSGLNLVIFAWHLSSVHR